MRDLSEIKLLRKKHGITQFELAKRANVSQSLIAKIESNQLDPSYNYVVKIFNALDSINNEKELKAADLASKRIVYVEPDSTLKDAIQKMKKYEISQLPVLENMQAVGMVSESIILDAMINKMPPSSKVSMIMNDAPPVITKNASAELVTNMLKYYPLVLVSEKGSLLGIITKSDMLRSVYK